MFICYNFAPFFKKYFFIMKIKAIVLVAILFTSSNSHAFFGRDCNLPDGLNVHASSQKLSVCERNRVVKEFRVALGTQGVGKKRQGDNKTPVGVYSLASPRSSERFGIFIPVQYPTQQQIYNGYTGGAIGIHGPTQRYRRFGSLRTFANWTQGCIALGSNDQISYIAKWVQHHPRARVYIS